MRNPWWAVLLAGLVASPLSLAAPITWTSKTYGVNGAYGQFLNTGVFDTTGVTILAENVGGGATTFDGINFSAGTIVFSGTFSGFHEASAPLSSTGTYGDSSPNTVTLSGLTVGKSYRVQALVYDGRGSTTGRRVKFDGIDQGQYANGVTNVTWGAGLLVTGTFVADAATQNFTVEAFSGTTSKGGQLNALLVHEFVAGAPGLTNPSVTAITTTDAQANATLSQADANVTLYWDTVDQGTGTWANSTPLGPQVVGPVSGTMGGLAPDTLYYYRFHGVNTVPDPDAEGWSPAETSFATALTGLAPTDPSATTFSKTEIDVAWTDTFNTETGFVIERSPNGADTWTQVGTVPANTGVFYDSNLLPGTTYYYRVVAQNEAGFSDDSTIVSATTNAPDPGITVQAHYRMGDDGQGTNNLPTDSSGNNRHFTTVATAAATVNATGGGYGNDANYTFNGVDQSYNSIGYDPPENNVGIEVWVKTSDLAQLNAHVFGTGTNANGLNISYDAADGRGWGGAVANVAWVGTGVGTTNYTTNTWIHLALVRDNGTTTFYVNGVASGTSTATPLNATQPRMAATYNNGVFFDGSVAEARIFTFDPGQFQVSHLLYPAPAPTDPYLAWSGAFPGLTNASANLDFDSGGLATGIEWVTGGDPTLGTDDKDNVPTFDNTTDPNHFRFIFKRRDIAAADANTSIVVEYGSDLAGWRNTADHGTADGVTVDASTDLGGGFHQVVVSIPRSLATQGRLFAQLKVGRP